MSECAAGAQGARCFLAGLLPDVGEAVQVGERVAERGQDTGGTPLGLLLN